MAKRALPSLLISTQDGVIDLGWGHPSPRLHPREALRQAADHVFSSEDVTSLQYGAIQGFGPLLESLAEFLSTQVAYGFSVEPQSLFLTSGASQAIDLASTLFTESGDTVLVEEPTYYLVQNIFEDHHLNVVGVPTDGDGLRTDALEDMLKNGSSPAPKLLYIIPSYQNPNGSVLSEDRRKHLAELADQYGFIVLADEVYQLLHYGPPPPRPLVAFDVSGSGSIISVGSFSKILAPGLRLGWVHAHPELIGRFANAGVSVSGGGMNHFTANLVNATLEMGLLQKNVEELKATYSARVGSMDEALQTHLSQMVDYTPPGGGYFFWLTFRDDLDTNALLPLAQQTGVSYRPGTSFSAVGNFSSAARLTFALYEADELNEGVRRLGSALENFLSSGQGG